MLDDPRRARAFFEALVADNVGIGRPEEVSLVFARRVTKATREPFRTRILSADSDVRIEFRYQHSRVKQYLKGGRAFRVEAVINKPSDLGVQARLRNLPELIDKARAYDRASRPELCHRLSLSASTSPTTERAKEPERCASGTHER